MSVLQIAGEAFRKTIETGLQTMGPGFQLAGARIVLDSPATVVREATNDTLVVFLFRVETEESVRNRPERTAPRAPGALPLRLWFLVTPFALNPQNDSLLLGAAMQVLQDNPAIPMGSAGGDLRVDLSPLPLLEMTALWQSLTVRYRIGVTYRVSIP